jgi:4-hydroxy-2-oxoheptanedioate aldolase
MGLLGQAGADEVRRAIRDGMAVVRAAGKAPGVLAPDREHAREYLEAGATFVAIGTDVSLLNTAANTLISSYRQTAVHSAEPSRSGY